MASIWEGAVALYRNLARMLGSACPIKVSEPFVYHVDEEKKKLDKTFEIEFRMMPRIELSSSTGPCRLMK